MLNFDATKVDPSQGNAKHPTGKFPAVVSEVGTDGNDTTGYFWVLFSTQAGQIRKQFNLWTKSTDDNMIKMTQIAQQNLSALCHATGVFHLGDGKELLNARCVIEVTPQKKNPEYNEVFKIFDANGNEPGKAPAGAPQTQQGGWNNQPATNPPQQPVQHAAPTQGGWQPGPANSVPATTPQAAQQPGWHQGPGPGQSPPWNNK